MANIIIFLLTGIFIYAGEIVQATTDADLQDTWVNVTPTNHMDDMLGNVRWETISFSTNGMVKWRWIREG